MTTETSTDQKRQQLYSWASDMLQNILNLSVSPETMQNIIGETMDNIFDNSDYNKEFISHDRETRLKIINMMCNYYLGHPWPKSANEVNIDEFYNNLNTAVKTNTPAV